jgi:tetratricopeptide (TPR) repeat protein
MQRDSATPADSAASPSSDFTDHGVHLLAQATDQARKGQYQLAYTLLEKAAKFKDCPEEERLDLQARIYSQQGMWLRAESCWTRALQLNPGNALYESGLFELRRAKRPVWPLPRLLLAAIVLFTVVYALHERSLAASRAQQLQHQLQQFQSAVDQMSAGQKARDSSIVAAQNETLQRVDAVHHEEIIEEHKIGLQLRMQKISQEQSLDAISADIKALRRSQEEKH